MKKLLLPLLAILFINIAKAQVRTPTLYVTGTVLSDEKMLVSVRDTKTIEGKVVSAELNGKKTEAKTDKKGHAILDFSSIAAGLVSPTVAVIKTFDKNGNLISSANTTVQKGNSRIPAHPVIEQLPANLPTREAVTIPGRNLGADAKLICGDQIQETLSASDREMTVFTDAPTGKQSAYVVTPNGVSESQDVNIYSIDFLLYDNSILPKQNVQAQVHYESIPAGTKLIFTNKSPETIKMTIPGGQNAANECIYTVTDKNGSLPVNITGLIKGNFQIALDWSFKDDPLRQNPTTDNSKGNNQINFSKNLVAIGEGGDFRLLDGKNKTIGTGKYDRRNEIKFIQKGNNYFGYLISAKVKFYNIHIGNKTTENISIIEFKEKIFNIENNGNYSFSHTVTYNGHDVEVPHYGQIFFKDSSGIKIPVGFKSETISVKLTKELLALFGLNYGEIMLLVTCSERSGVAPQGQCGQLCGYYNDRENPAVRCAGFCTLPDGHAGRHTCSVNPTSPDHGK